MPTSPREAAPARRISLDTSAVALAFLLAALVRLGLLKTIPW